MRANDHESSSDDERERAVAVTRYVFGCGGVGGAEGGIWLNSRTIREGFGFESWQCVVSTASSVFRLVLSVDRRCHLSIYLSTISRQLAAAPFLSLSA